MAGSATALGLSSFTPVTSLNSGNLSRGTSQSCQRRAARKILLLTPNINVECRASFPAACVGETNVESRSERKESGELLVSRRSTISIGSVLLSSVCGAGSALAITPNQTPGRVPGLSEPDGSGLRQYKRPEGKSGGHGVGWSEMIPYSFKVPEDWAEVPVSIADLGGTEIDLRFQSKTEGNISVVVAPCQRFSDRVGNNARIEDIGTPERVIYAFGPEITGQNVEGLVKDMQTKNVAGRTYYVYELNTPHQLVTATAAGNRLYIFSVAANGRQWKKYEEGLRQISESFRVG